MTKTRVKAYGNQWIEFKSGPILVVSLAIGVVWLFGFLLVSDMPALAVYRGTVIAGVCYLNFLFLTKTISEGVELAVLRRSASFFLILQAVFFGFLKFSSLILLGLLLYRWRNELDALTMVMGLGVCAVLPLAAISIWAWRQAQTDNKRKQTN